jgi:hypothetical protein
MLFSRDVLLSLLIVAVPAWYFNKFLLRTVRPKESFPKFLLYVFICLAAAFAYTMLAVFTFIKIVGPPNK